MVIKQNKNLFIPNINSALKRNSETSMQIEYVHYLIRIGEKYFIKPAN